MIGKYLNQTATWKLVASTDGYPAAAQSPGTSIAVRWEGKRRMVRDPYGQEVVSEARVFCTAAVKPGDVLTYGGRDWPVLAVSEGVGLSGSVEFYEVAV